MDGNRQGRFLWLGLLAVDGLLVAGSGGGTARCLLETFVLGFWGLGFVFTKSLCLKAVLESSSKIEFCATRHFPRSILSSLVFRISTPTHAAV